MRLLSLGLLLAFSLSAASRDGKIGEAGKFDYYLLTLSWSPAYCASTGDGRSDPQCAPGRQLSFVLHGLWPQYSRSTNGSMWPQFCTSEPGLRDPKTVLDIMPSTSLIRHEWTKHGTCTGLSAEGYFATARKAMQSVRIPPRFIAPKEYLNPSPGEVKQEFLKANPGMTADSIAIQCSANYLSEVRVCLDRNLKPIPCADKRECRAPKVRMPPVR
ncbi:MAG TPA: ribonuclease T2 [Paludibaculum sp.]|jgi:ribonuclease T2